MPTTESGRIMDELFIRSLLAGIGVAVIAGALGCFVVWRRMAYFGDALSHSALLGVAFGLLLGLDLQVGVAIIAALFAVLLVLLQRQPTLAADTLLGILAHGALASGLILLAFFEHVRVDLLGYLFGDILTVGTADLLWIYGGGIVVLGGLALIWRPLLAASVHEDLARVEGVAVVRVRFALVGLIALIIAAAIQVVGALLVTSLLIVPAATARRLARSPEGMAVMAALIGAASSSLGLAAAFNFDLPAGPSIVLAAVFLFALSRLGSAARP